MLSLKNQGNSGLRAISGIVHAHHSCGGKRGKLSGSHLSTIFKFASIQVSDTLTSADISAFSGQNKVTKMCPKYLLRPVILNYCLSTKY